MSDAALLSELEAVERCLGEGAMLGVAARFLPTGVTVLYHADEIFPTASVIKVAIIAELFVQEAEGRLDTRVPVTVTVDALVGGSGVLAHLTPGVTLSLADLATLTIMLSDNTASNLCLAAVGGPEAVNRRMAGEWGMAATRIHRPIQFRLEPGDPPHTATGSPRDMMELATLLARDAVGGPAVSTEVRRRMGLVRDTEKLPRYLFVNPYAADAGAAPPFLTERKTGEVTGVRNDAGLIRRGDETLAVCVYTKGVDDPRWTVENRASEAVARVGEILARRFFP